MAERHLIKGIDNNCEAVRAAVRRAEQSGVAGPKRLAPLIKGIDNSSGTARGVRRPAEENGVTWPKRLVPLINGIDNTTVEAARSRLRIEAHPLESTRAVHPTRLR